MRKHAFEPFSPGEVDSALTISLPYDGWCTAATLLANHPAGGRTAYQGGSRHTASDRRDPSMRSGTLPAKRARCAHKVYKVATAPGKVSCRIAHHPHARPSGGPMAVTAPLVWPIC